MTDTYAAAKEQLDDIVAQVRKKDVSLERSLDLLEEGVALANRCTELIDQAAWEDLDVDDSADELAEDADADEAELVDIELARDTDNADNDELKTAADNPEMQAYTEQVLTEAHTEEIAGNNELTAEHTDT